MKNVLDSWTVRLATLDKDPVKADVCVVPVWKQKKVTGWLKKFDASCDGALSDWLSSAYVQEDREKTLFIKNKQNLIHAKDILLVCLGEVKKSSPTTFRNALGQASKVISNRGYSSVSVLQSVDQYDFTFAIEGFLLGAYRFSKYQQDEKLGQSLKQFTFFVKADQKRKLQSNLDKVLITTKANFLSRDLVNEPGNIMYPEAFAKVAQEVAKTRSSLSVKVLTKTQIQKENMRLVMAVGQASQYEPRVLHLHYKPKKKAKTTVALIGKGVTFDTGGLSLKPPGSMVSMKTDMAGAASVMGAMQAVSDLGLPVEVHGIIGLVENAVSSNATRPDDVVKSRQGKTVEILNTDAEGRLVLADILNYAEELNVDYMIDAATLTGACVVALGEEIFALYSTDEGLSKKIKKASEEVGDKAWPMPMEESYRAQLKSDIADLKNIGSGREAGSITAALFLSEFVKSTKWAHLDIAGPARATKDYDTAVKGATGIPSRTFIRFLENL